MSENNINEQTNLPEDVKPTFKEKANNVLGMFIPREGYFITPIIVNINILIFLIMAFSGVDIMQPDIDSLVNWGANYRPVTLDSQIWRLFTCCFLHIGVIHLALNMYALISIGILLEPVMKKTNFLIAYILTGIAASAASLWWHDNTVSAGASGAIFGMYGVFLAMLTTNLIEKAERQEQLKSIGIFVAYNLIFGLKGGIDNAAHIGGLLSGIVAGYCFYFILKNPDSSSTKNGLIAGFTVMVFLFAGAIYYTTSNDMGTYTKAMEEFSKKEEVALEVYKEPRDTVVKQILTKLEKGIVLWKENIVLIESLNKLNLPDGIKAQNKILSNYCNERLICYNLLFKAYKENSGAYNTEIEASNTQIELLIKQLKSPNESN